MTMGNLKLAFRMLFKTPFVTIVAIVSLALGIGANAAIFSLFNQMLLRPLPVQQPDRLVNFAAPGPKQGSNSCNQAGDCDTVFSYPMFRDLEKAQTTFTGIAAHRLFGANLAFGGQTLNGEGLFVSGSYFPVLGVQPALGRLLGPDDDRTVGESHVAVLSDAWWEKRLASDPGTRGQSSTPGEARAPLTLLLGVTAFVLLIACANIANLLLARSAARAGEMAVRLSLGASRRQLVGQLLVESCLLAVFGGVGGLFVARWTLDLIASLLPTEAADMVQMQLDAAVLLFASALTLGTGLLFGLFPALHSTRPDLVSTLKGQSGQPSGARAAARFRPTLATAQIALSMALLIAAGLFTKSLFNVSRVDLGLKVDNVVT